MSNSHDLFNQQQQYSTQYHGSSSPSITLSLSSCDYIPFESHADNFRTIQIHPSMGWEHFPHKYEILNDVCQEWKNRHHRRTADEDLSLLPNHHTSSHNSSPLNDYKNNKTY